MAQILVIHGPNLNLLGTREPEIYGSRTLEDVNELIVQEAESLGCTVRIMQSNEEGAIVDAIGEARNWADAIIINPAAFTHTSVAILDALKAVAIPTVEVHISNVHARESFRQNLVTTGGATGQICGFGAASYILAVHAVACLVDEES
ncbi:MAG: type II 3-dehydroquinate dehydratase [Candidatus Hydrogenedentes bacterium]|nr:type II 3-dehydroquinate dehydratase [Candidatus Hydrogenedentota bacterium]